ncbi:angiotensinogen [Bufo bufo]|uniref:angiotensinogen n=1 Tax=Bufo bufo TaxID=8384 RepID=UPI001ABE6072|nr:angiotensinogen [Bufo bufo]XP_040285367.1 angiotensinogen [Bufo bufo]
MYLQEIMLWFTAFIGLSTCNRVYVHPFNLLTYNKSECENIQFHDHSSEMFFPTAIESKNNADENNFELQRNLEAGHIGTTESYLISIINSVSFRAVAGWWKLRKTDSILIPYTDFFRTMVSFYLGASGNTSNSLQTFLGLEDKSGSTNCTSKVNGFKVISTLQNIDTFLFSKDSNINTLRTVCMFVSPNVPLSKKVVHGLTLTADNFYVRTVDFKDSTKAVKLINDFLDSKLPANAISGLTSINVIADFMYISHVQFKGKVANSFLLPKRQPFWTEPNKIVLVPMIAVSGIFQFTEDSTANQLIIKISLSDNDFLLLVQPLNGNTLENIESSMNWNTYQEWVNGLSKRSRYINLSLPKLKIERSYNIQDLLSSLEVSELLGKNADFSKMSKTNIKVGKVINTIDFELEESGTDPHEENDIPETKEEPLEVMINRPFILALCEGTTKSLLLLGRVIHPTNII